MANEIHIKDLSSVTAQASAAITADNFSGGSQTAISRQTSGNAEGAYQVDCWAVVTVAPSGGDATLILYTEASPDGTNYAVAEACGRALVEDGDTGHYHLGPVEMSYANKFKLFAADYGVTASLVVVPQVPELQ